MSSTRIPITNNFSCTRGAYGIDHSMPAILTGRMTKAEWISFCDRVDEVLKPLNKLRFIYVISHIGFAVAIFAIVFWAFASTSTYNNNYNDDSFNSSSSGQNAKTWLPWVVIAISFFLLIGFSCYVSTRTGTAFNDVKEICDETARNRTDISFHLRDERMSQGYYSGGGYYSGHRTYHNIYIETSMSTGAVHIVQNPTPVIVTNSNPAEAMAYPIDPELGNTSKNNTTDIPMVQVRRVDTRSKTAHKRLKNLENVRDMLSEKEYKEKREQILNDL